MEAKNSWFVNVSPFPRRYFQVPCSFVFGGVSYLFFMTGFSPHPAPRHTLTFLTGTQQRGEASHICFYHSNLRRGRRKDMVSMGPGPPKPTQDSRISCLDDITIFLRIGIPCKPSCATGILGWGVDPKHGALRKNPAAQHVIQANTFLVLGHAHTLWGIGSHSLQRCKCDKIPRFVDHWSQDPNAESAPVIPIHNIGDLYTVYWILNYLAVRKCGCGRTQKEGINKQPRLHETRNRWLLLVMIKPG